MHYYTTLFDSFYLSRGLIMYRSLRSRTDKFHLYIFAFDDIAFNTLNLLKLENVTIISLNELETPGLKEVKKTRSKAEYCWTCTPAVISYVLENYNVPECTYLDSDLCFYSDPSVLISELDSIKKNVLISEHRYSFFPRLYEEKRAGRFCVQFMTFRQDEDSMRILDKWRKQCLDWCYARHEEGKFGDQKYLDEWPEKYENVHILENHGGGLAPWNLLNYSLSKETDEISLIHKKTGRHYDLVFYHFQYVKSLSKRKYDIGWYPIPPIIKRKLYSAYVKNIERTEIELQNINKHYIRAFTSSKSYIAGNLMKKILKKVLGYNIMKFKINGISD